MGHVLPASPASPPELPASASTMPIIVPPASASPSADASEGGVTSTGVVVSVIDASEASGDNWLVASSPPQPTTCIAIKADVVPRATVTAPNRKALILTSRTG